MTKQNYLNLSPGPKPPKVVYCYVEIPKGESNKYEYDKEKGIFFLDRVLYSPVFYPTEYGFIPKTKTDDGDPLDIMVILSSATFPGCLIEAKVIGALEIIDSGKQDTKIISVAINDPRTKHIKSIKDLSPHFQSEITHFWENYAQSQPEKEIKVLGWKESKAAQEIVSQAVKNYQEK